MNKKAKKESEGDTGWLHKY